LTGFLFLTLLTDNLSFFIAMMGGMVFSAALTWTYSIATLSACASNQIQGKIFGINQSMGAMAALIGPSLGSYLVHYNIHYSWVLSAVASLFGCILILSAQKNLSKPV
jgi:MFS family permease